ncbi:MAG: MarR family transcriptional regulator [Chitinophagales bacterium]|nr:MarR family transcriptional regulator [Hyphomicrobiales bacterium]
MKNLDDQDKLQKAAQLRAIVETARKIHSAMDAVDALVSERLSVHRSDLRSLNLLEHGPLSASQIGARTGLTSGSVTALIDRLERAGFVERRRSAEDRRRVDVAIPDERFETIGSLYRHVAQSVIRQFADKNASELAVATEVLQSFARALEDAKEAMASNGTAK